MGENSGNGGGAVPERISAGEKRFWGSLWEQPESDIAADWGVDLVRFGPVVAGCITGEAPSPEANFLLGAGEARSVTHGHLAHAIAWLESRPPPADPLFDFEGTGVDFRVPVLPGLPESAAAREWLAQRQGEPEATPGRLTRDCSPLAVSPPAEIEVLDWDEPDEGFGEAVAEALDMPGTTEVLFLCLLENDSDAWRCYCAVHGDDALAYAAVHSEAGVATVALASRPAAGLEGEGQAALLQRVVADASAAGCDLLTVATAGQDPPTVERESLLRAGFDFSLLTPTWRCRVEVEA